MINKLFAAFAFLFIVIAVSAQEGETKEDIQRKQQQLQREIDDLNKTLGQIKSSKKKSLGQLALVQRKIAARNQLINNINKDLRRLDNTIYLNQLEINRMKVELDSLKDNLYSTMAKAKKQLQNEINKSEYYLKSSGAIGILLIVISVIMMAYGVFALINSEGTWWQGIAFIASGIITIIFAAFMTKKTKKGTELYQKLSGFKEFIRSVEKDRLREFLKQDENYFDKVLPYAIVFDVADRWKDKLKDLDIPPPKWYVGNYATFSTINFMNSLDHSMNEMSRTFYSTPNSSGSSGGSFGGGGSSGGGFGGGGGSSW